MQHRQDGSADPSFSQNNPHFCGDDHIALAQHPLVFEHHGKAMMSLETNAQIFDVVGSKRLCGAHRTPGKKSRKSGATVKPRFKPEKPA